MDSHWELILALHVIFIVTWFSGLFYIVRLFVYNREAQDKSEPEKSILYNQFSIMIKRLWFGITWPSAILTIILGLTLFKTRYNFIPPLWLEIKLVFIVGLLFYHLSLHKIYSQQKQGIFKYSSQQLRIWNEVATILLLVIVMLAIFKPVILSEIDWIWSTIGVIGFIVILTFAIFIYKKVRMKKGT